MMELKRMWINQPSTLQQHHDLKGRNVLTRYKDKVFVRVWFVDGPVISQKIARNVLSHGWRETEKDRDNA